MAVARPYNERSSRKTRLGPCAKMLTISCKPSACRVAPRTAIYVFALCAPETAWRWFRKQEHRAFTNFLLKKPRRVVDGFLLKFAEQSFETVSLKYCQIL